MYVPLVDNYSTGLKIISCTCGKTCCILNNIYSKNSIDYRFLLLTLLQVKDAGGSMIIHAFGGYYGLTISWVLHRSNLGQSKRLHGSVYHSDVFAMIGEKICFFQTQNFYKHMI